MNVNSFFKTYQRVVVLDTGFTTWEGAYERGWSDPQEHREIFQVSALKMDLKKGDVLDMFERYVKPRINPMLSDYAKKFTGVTQQQVDSGVDFEVMYLDLMVWSDGLPVCTYLRSAKGEGEGEVIKENIDLYGLNVPYNPDRYINLVDFFKDVGVDVANSSSGELYQCFNLELPGHVHNTNHDVHSLAYSLLAMKEEKFLGPKPRRFRYL